MSSALRKLVAKSRNQLSGDRTRSDTRLSNVLSARSASHEETSLLSQSLVALRHLHSTHHFNMALAYAIQNRQWRQVGELESSLAMRHDSDQKLLNSPSLAACWDDVDSNVESVSCPSSAPPINPTAETFQLLMAGRLQVGDWVGALQYFEDHRRELLPVGDVTLRMVIRALHTSSPHLMWHQALHLFRSYQHCVTSGRTLDDVLEMLRSAGKFESVLQLYNECRESIPMELDSLLTVSAAAERTGEWRTACQLASASMTSQMPLHAQKSLITGAGNALMARYMFHECLRVFRLTVDRPLLQSSSFLVAAARAAFSADDVSTLISILECLRRYHDDDDRLLDICNLAHLAVHNVALKQETLPGIAAAAATMSAIVSVAAPAHTRIYPSVINVDSLRNADATTLGLALQSLAGSGDWCRSLHLFTTIVEDHEGQAKILMERQLKSKSRYVPQIPPWRGQSPVTVWVVEEVAAAFPKSCFLQRIAFLRNAIAKGWVTSLCAEFLLTKAHLSAQHHPMDAPLVAFYSQALVNPHSAAAQAVATINALQHSSSSCEALTELRHPVVEMARWCADTSRDAADILWRTAAANALCDVLCYSSELLQGLVNGSAACEVAIALAQQDFLKLISNHHILFRIIKSLLGCIEASIEARRMTAEVAASAALPAIAAVLSAATSDPKSASNESPLAEETLQSLISLSIRIKNPNTPDLWILVRDSFKDGDVGREVAFAVLRWCCDEHTERRTDGVISYLMGPRYDSDSARLLQVLHSLHQLVREKSERASVLFRCSDVRTWSAKVAQAHPTAAAEFCVLLANALARDEHLLTEPSAACEARYNLLMLIASLPLVPESLDVAAVFYQWLEGAVLPGGLCGAVMQDRCFAVMTALRSLQLPLMRSLSLSLERYPALRERAEVVRGVAVRVHVTWLVEGFRLTSKEIASILAVPCSDSMFLQLVNGLETSHPTVWCDASVLTESLEIMRSHPLLSCNATRLADHLSVQGSALLRDEAFCALMLSTALEAPSFQIGRGTLRNVIIAFPRLVRSLSAQSDAATNLILAATEYRPRVMWRTAVQWYSNRFSAKRERHFWTKYDDEKAIARALQPHADDTALQQLFRKRKAAEAVTCALQLGADTLQRHGAQQWFDVLSAGTKDPSRIASLPWHSFQQLHVDAKQVLLRWAQAAIADASCCDERMVQAVIVVCLTGGRRSTQLPVSENVWKAIVLVVEEHHATVTNASITQAFASANLLQLIAFGADKRRRETASCKLRRHDRVEAFLQASMDLLTHSIITRFVVEGCGSDTGSQHGDMLHAFVDACIALGRWRDLISAHRRMAAVWPRETVANALTSSEERVEAVQKKVTVSMPCAPKHVQPLLDLLASTWSTLDVIDELLHRDGVLDTLIQYASKCWDSSHGGPPCRLDEATRICRAKLISAAKALLRDDEEPLLKVTRAFWEAIQQPPSENNHLQKRDVAAAEVVQQIRARGLVSESDVDHLLNPSCSGISAFQVMQSLSFPHTPARIPERLQQAAVQAAPDWQSAMQLVAASCKTVQLPTAVQRHLAFCVLDKMRRGRWSGGETCTAAWDVAVRMFVRVTEGNWNSVPQRHFTEVLRHCTANADVTLFLYNAYRRNSYRRTEGANALLSLLKAAKHQRRVDLVELAIDELAKQAASGTLAEHNRMQALKELSSVSLVFPKSEKLRLLTRLQQGVRLAEAELLLFDGGAFR